MIMQLLAGVRALRSLFNVVLLVATAAGAVAADGIVAGQVLNAETGRGVPGATVRVPGSERSGTTDLEGGFRVAGVPAGTHAVTVAKEGFQTFNVSGVVVTAGEPARVDVALTAVRDSVVKLEAFTVSAEAMQSSGVGLLGARQKATAVSDAIGSDQMSKLGFGTAAAAMKAVTGA
jgi:hypothetical protein